MVSLVFVVFALIEFALILVLNRRQAIKSNSGQSGTTPKKENGIPLTAEKLFRRVAPLTVVEEKENVRLETANAIADGSRMTTELGKSVFVIPPIHVIDFIAFWVHFSCFMLFNLIYSFYYLA